MSRWHDFLLLQCVGLTAFAGLLAPAPAEESGLLGYGSTPTAAQIAGWDIDVRGDDGMGLPPGKGNVQEGR